jgi:hypothetical protein
VCVPSWGAIAVQHQCGDFLCDANGNPDLTKPNPIGLQEDLNVELVGASAANAIFSADVFFVRAAGEASNGLFARGGGILNSNDYFGIGYGWQGSATAGSKVFRVAIGSKRLPIHWHFTLWRY